MKLFDYLKMEFPGLTPEDTKVHLAQINDYKEDPLVKFRAETFDEWQCWQKRLEFNRRYVVSLIRIPGTETWLFAGAFQQKGNAGKKAYPGREELYYQYLLEKLPETEEYAGRMYISFKNTARNFIRLGESIQSELVISSITPVRLTFGEFPGYRNVVLIPASAHGTNPASAAMAGMKIVTVACDANGNIDVEDLEVKAKEYSSELCGLMVTYPSTHGVFESRIREIVDAVHDAGGQVYMDGANMNAQVGLTNPGFIGADVCHLNLHKTFASPHGGGGPGVGPICVAEHLVPFLPGHGLFGNAANEVAAAPFGSAGILPITYGYIRMMGAEGLARATQTAILNANYLAACFKDTYGIVYRGANGFVGHEMILECRKVHEETGISENDIAKRLMDYGYHAPTLSFPVHGTLMIEPTESESLAELDNFVHVMLAIWQEIQEVKNGEADKTDNVLVNAPHPEYEVVADTWEHSYTRQKAAYPIESVRDNKFWVNVARVDNTLGDRKLLPTCYGCFE